LATKCCTANPPTDGSCEYYSELHTATKGDEYIVVKDVAPQKPYGYLLMPSFAVTGIEDTKRTEVKPVVEFWQFGWKEATEHLKKLEKQPEDTALAINSKPGRDQDQLHIHLSCVLPSVAAALTKAGKISTDPTKPTEIPLGPHNNRYEIITMTSLTDAHSPFKMIEDFPHAKGHIGDQSIAIIGTGKTNPPSYYYMAVTYYVPHKNPGTAEELLDQTNDCGKLKAARKINR
jgi:CDP-diacylglycerol pyrophosphatase